MPQSRILKVSLIVLLIVLVGAVIFFVRRSASGPDTASQVPSAQSRPPLPPADPRAAQQSGTGAPMEQMSSGEPAGAPVSQEEIMTRQAEVIRQQEAATQEAMKNMSVPASQE